MLENMGLQALADRFNRIGVGHRCMDGLGIHLADGLHLRRRGADDQQAATVVRHQPGVFAGRHDIPNRRKSMEWNGLGRFAVKSSLRYCGRLFRTPRPRRQARHPDPDMALPVAQVYVQFLHGVGWRAARSVAQPCEHFVLAPAQNVQLFQRKRQAGLCLIRRCVQN